MSTSRSDDNSSFRAELSAGFEGLSTSQLDALCEHYRLLLSWNERLNLTRVVSAAEAARIHYVESLFLGAQLPPGELRIVDVGSGAGFPGIPLAILRPECKIDLVESHQRKAVFLREAIRGLSNVRVLAKRAEDVSTQYDWLVSRAVRPTEVLSLRMAPNVAILMGAEDVESARIVPVPGSDRRVVAMFHVERLSGRDKI
jgi:16S rRNA (guanine527-N7)-methyltransferase